MDPVHSFHAVGARQIITRPLRLMKAWTRGVGGGGSAYYLRDWDSSTISFGREKKGLLSSFTFLSFFVHLIIVEGALTRQLVFLRRSSVVSFGL